MVSSVIEVLEIIVENGSNSEQRYEATNLLESMQSFNFVFSLHLMRTILEITNELSQALQRKDQDIVNSMTLVKVCKQQFQMMRDNGWSYLLDQVSYFCERHKIDIPSMNDTFLTRGRSRRKAHEMKNLHHYQIELFYVVMDMQLQELNSRFTEVNTELLLCVAYLNLCDSFIAFDKQKLLRLNQFYPQDFSPIELRILNDQLETYIIDMRSSSEFSELKGISDLAQKMVETKRHIVCPLVYFLVTWVTPHPSAHVMEKQTHSSKYMILLECLHAQSHVSSPHRLPHTCLCHV